jgi:hypothetical protein
VACANDINLLGNKTGAIKRTTKTVIDNSNEVGLDAHIVKTKYMLLTRRRNAGQNRHIKIINRSFENVSQFRYLGIRVTNQNLILKEIKRRMNSVMLAAAQSRMFYLPVCCL